jgi:Ca2+-transporting ATPase
MVKGDPLDVLGLCERQMQADGTILLSQEARAAIRQANAAMAGRALRVLGFAYATAHDLNDLAWVGLVGLADEVRPSAKPLVLTGDQVATARAIADELGLNGNDHSVVVAEAARDAADIVMQTEDLAALAVAIEQGRATFDNVRRATGYLLGTNFSEIAYVVAGTAAGGEPLSPAQLLWINIVSDVLPGIGLSAEPPHPATMQRPPRASELGVLSGSELRRLLTEGSVIAAGALASSTWGRLRFGAGPEMRTMAFCSLLLGQLLHAFNRRERERQPGGNPTFTAAMGVTSGAQAIAFLIPALRHVLGAVPLGPGELAVTLAGGVVPFLVN